MSQVGDVRDGLVTALDTIDGLNVAKWIGQNIRVPMAVVGWPTVTYDEAMQRGLDTWTIPIQIFVGLADNRTAVNRLEDYMDGAGAMSVKAAIEADTTLGGACDDVRVSQLGETFEGVDTTSPSIVYLAAQWDVDVLVDTSDYGA